jgi:hypothetical protein
MRTSIKRSITWVLALIVAVGFIGFMVQQNSSANHPVLVEGDLDFDGDGRLGTAEDTDVDANPGVKMVVVGTSTVERIFGTLTGGLGAANGAANFNGAVTVVTSGRFRENVVIATLNGVTVLQAAPGVNATVDAIIPGNPDGQNPTRQGLPGLSINNATTDRGIIVRNMEFRNFAEGIRVMGTTRAQILNCRFDSNNDYGIRVMGDARVAIVDSTVNASGQRFPIVGTPTPGTGIRFEGHSSGLVARTTSSGNTRTGISTGSTRSIILSGNLTFDNQINVGTNRTTPSSEKPFIYVDDLDDIEIDEDGNYTIHQINE